MTPRERVARRLVLGLLGRLSAGELRLGEPDGRTHHFGRAGSTPRADLTLHDPAVWRAFLQGSYGLGSAYADGLWDSTDLVALTRLAARNVHGLDRLREIVAPVRHPISRAARAVHAPTIHRSRRQIAAHYDLGNDMFGLMLDETMSYSAAWFDAPETALLDASSAKLERTCRKLSLQPGDHLLEIGSGWGGLAIYAAQRFGCRVTTTTISAAQADLARERVERAGVADRVTVLLEDYRELKGRYDRLVSIEMIEAVGYQYFDTYFRRCSELLEPHGRAVIQAITIADRAYEVEKHGRSFVNTLVFPGGCLPSRTVIDDCVARVTDMRELGYEDMTDHYVLTLQHWRERFSAATDALDVLGYDERFRRLWRLYLCYSEGGFAERRIAVGQYLLAKPGCISGAPPVRAARVPATALRAGALKP